MAAKDTSGNPTSGAEPKKRRGRPARPVVCLETGAVYASAKDAAILCKIGKPGNITRAIRSNTSSGGLHWSYAQNLQPDTPLLEAHPALTQRAVICYETGEVFHDARAVADSIGGKRPSDITTAIARGATVGGFHWYYADQPRPEKSELTDLDAWRKGQPVVCYETGVEYESATDAAQILGLRSGASVTRAIRERQAAGGYHWYFADQPRPDESAFADGRARRRRAIVCYETGEEFPSVTAAAKAVGLKRTAGVSTAAKNGGVAGGYHWYYADEPRPTSFEVKDTKIAAKRPVICVETGQTFDSLKDAAAAIGVKSSSNFIAAIKENRTLGGYHWRYADLEAPVGTPSDQSHPKPVVCYETGEVFESLAAAGRSVGVKANTVASAIRKAGTAGGYHWYFEGQEKPSAEDLKRPSQSQTRAVMCWETGEAFPSVRDAAEAVGINSSTAIRFAIKNKTMSGGFHWRYADEPKPFASDFKQPRPAPRAVVCIETGKVYPSAKAVAEAIGLKSEAGIYTAIRKKTTSGKLHWKWAD